jgi:hypothetical protein
LKTEQASRPATDADGAAPLVCKGRERIVAVALTDRTRKTTMIPEKALVRFTVPPCDESVAACFFSEPVSITKTIAASQTNVG